MRNWILLGLALVALIPGVGLVLFASSTLHEWEQTVPLLAAAVLAIAVLGAAFLLNWSVEVAEMDVPRAVALSALALIAVLPEYAVDISLTYTAGSNEAYRPFAIANMIGANRMLVGFAWPLIIVLFCIIFKRRHLFLEPTQRVEIGFLLLAGLYSLVLPFKGQIDLYDGIILVVLFGLYSWRIIKSPVEENEELIGPATLLARLTPLRRRLSLAGLFLIAAAAIFVIAEPFAETLIASGTKFGIDQVFMVQWVAPVASEAPEIIAAILFTLRGRGADGLGAVVASKVNQWTLLVATLPLVYLLGSNGKFSALPLHGTVRDLNGNMATYDLILPMLVTSGQTLLAVMIVITLRAGYIGALTLFGLLVAQFFMPTHFSIGDQLIDHNLPFALIYLGLALILALRHYSEFGRITRSIMSPAYVLEQQEAAEKEEEEKEILK